MADHDLAPDAGAVNPADPISEIIAGWDAELDGTCWQCGGDGVVYDCFEEWACVDPEGGCDMCERRCDVCQPRRVTLAHMHLPEKQSCGSCANYWMNDRTGRAHCTWFDDRHVEASGGADCPAYSLAHLHLKN